MKEFLSENIYKNLFLLSKWKEPSPEFMKFFKKDMFIKPNSEAFPYVMQYLFNILNPSHFKKNFLWPLSDKKMEAEFRSSTICYLNYLKCKHKLAYETVKSHIVVLPGGIRFMKVLFELSSFIMHEEMRQIVKNQPNLTIPSSFREKAKDLRETKAFVDVCEFYKQKLIENTIVIKTETEKLSKALISLTKLSRIEECLKEWKEHINYKTENELEPELKKINNFNRKLQKLNQFSGKLLVAGIKNRIDCEEDAFRNCLIKLNSEYFSQTEVELLNQTLVVNNKINFSTLFNQFEYILPILLNDIFIYRSPLPKKLEYDEQILRKLHLTVVNQEARLITMNDEIKEALKPVHIKPIPCTNTFGGVKLMSTPKIVLQPSRPRRQLLIDVLDRKNLNPSFEPRQKANTTIKSKTNVLFELDKENQFDLKTNKSWASGNRQRNCFDVLEMIRTSEKRKHPKNPCKDLSTDIPSTSGYRPQSTSHVFEMIRESEARTRLEKPDENLQLLSSTAFALSLNADTTLEAVQSKTGFSQINLMPESFLRRRRMLNMSSVETSPSGLLCSLVKIPLGRRLSDEESEEKLLLDTSGIDLVN